MIQVLDYKKLCFEVLFEKALLSKFCKKTLGRCVLGTLWMKYFEKDFHCFFYLRCSFNLVLVAKVLQPQPNNVKLTLYDMYGSVFIDMRVFHNILLVEW